MILGSRKVQPLGYLKVETILWPREKERSKEDQEAFEDSSEITQKVKNAVYVSLVLLCLPMDPVDLT